MKIELNNVEVWSLKQIVESRILEVQASAKGQGVEPETYEVFDVLKGIIDKLSYEALKNG